MSLIDVRGLSFHYEGSPDNVFENVSFQIDTDWKLGFISRNGRGKTTFLRLLCGAMPYQGVIEAGLRFDYFPFPTPDASRPALDVARDAVAPFDAWQREMDACLARGDDASLQRYGTLLERMLANDGYSIDALLEREAGKLGVAPDALQRPFDTLSHGERTKLLIAALFLREGGFPLIDEPTNHLDAQGRKALTQYLAGTKKGFILVSHDRALLDGVCDHVLSINRAGIEVQRGSYSSWKRNHDLQNEHERAQNEQLRGEIGRLTQTAREKASWSDRVEATKIGTHAADRGAISAQAARVMKKSKAIERRVEAAIGAKEALLKNVETADTLKIRPLPYHKRILVEAIGVQVDFGAGALFAPLSFTLAQGERVALTGPNGAGKTSLLRMLAGEEVPHGGLLRMGQQMTVSYVRQDASHLRGLARDWAATRGLDLTLFLTILRKLDFTREAFDRPMEDYSAGMQKKVLLAASLATSAHLYLWDEPLNYIDVLSRVQIEGLLATSGATMVFIEHDSRFVRAVATRAIALERV